MRTHISLKLTFIYLAIVLASLLPAHAHATPPRVDTLNDAWLDISMGPPLIPLFNRMARPTDIARAENVSQMGELDQITAGRTLVVFRSVAEAEESLPDVADRIDILGYNLEYGPGTPEEEQADPVGSVQRMQALAEQYDLSFALGPDHDFAVSHGAAMAPYVDIFVLQIQRVQTTPSVAQEFVRSLVPQLRKANSDLEVSVQVRTEGDVDDIVALLDSLKDHLDGVSILTSPETVDVANTLVAELRPAAAVQPAQQPMGIFVPSWVLALVGAAIVGGIGGGVIAWWICTSQKETV